MTNQKAEGAAARALAAAGRASASLNVLQDSNNTVFADERVVAKVGTMRHSDQALRLEHAVCTHLLRADAPVAAPLDGAVPFVDVETGFTVTLWERIAVHPGRAASPAELAESLTAVHAALASYSNPLPSFGVSIQRAHEVLGDDRRMEALPPDDLRFLRSSFELLARRLGQLKFDERALHGEPHDANVIVTATGVRWVDFESACRGPVEWDVSCLPASAAELIGSVDPTRLAVLRLLQSARVATWCWARVDHPDMREHAEHHLGVLRAQLS